MQESYDVTGSKSLTDLADLPTVQNPKKVAAGVAVKGWDDSGIDDWNFDDVREEEASPPNKFTSSASISPEKQPGKWSPP